MSNIKGKRIFCYRFSPETFRYALVHDPLAINLNGPPLNVHRLECNTDFSDNEKYNYMF